MKKLLLYQNQNINDMEYNENYYKEKAKLFKTIRIILICIALSPIALLILMIILMSLSMQNVNTTLPF